MRTRSLASGSSAVRLLVSLVLLALAATIFWFRQPLYDQFTVWYHQPSPEAAALADRAELTGRGKFLFYASRPELLNRDSFNDACRSLTTEQTAVLGCCSAMRIYLFDISDRRLEGIKEVTAAHEMLHAVYERLSKADKARVDALLERQELGDDEERIAELMAQYEKTEPGQRHNELHSIIGTEVATLSPELEAYYAPYFADRSALVAKADSYQGVFAQLKSQQQDLVDELNELADQIDQRGSTYRRELEVLGADIESFNGRAGQGSMTRSEYESERAELERRQARLSREYDALNDLISSYEAKRSELAAINSQSDALNRSINSSLKPATESIDG